MQACGERDNKRVFAILCCTCFGLWNEFFGNRCFFKWHLSQICGEVLFYYPIRSKRHVKSLSHSGHLCLSSIFVELGKDHLLMYFPKILC